MSSDNPVRTSRRRRGGRPASEVGQPVERDVNYRQLRNPFPSMDVFSTDEINNMHETALTMLEEMGMKVLLPEARALFANLTAVARTTPIFQEYGVEEFFTFFDFAKMLGYTQITISNGRDFTHQVFLE